MWVDLNVQGIWPSWNCMYLCAFTHTNIRRISWMLELSRRQVRTWYNATTQGFLLHSRPWAEYGTECADSPPRVCHAPHLATRGITVVALFVPSTVDDNALSPKPFSLLSLDVVPVPVGAGGPVALPCPTHRHPWRCETIYWYYHSIMLMKTTNSHRTLGVVEKPSWRAMVTVGCLLPLAPLTSSLQDVYI